MSRRSTSRRLRANGLTYAPEHEAPRDGEYLRSGKTVVGWRQDHRELVIAALRSWRGAPATVNNEIYSIRQGEPTPDGGHGKQQRAWALALLWETLHNPRRSAYALYRGSHIPPQGLQSWSGRRKVAEMWAKKNNGQVFMLPKGTLGLRASDYIDNDLFGEREWVVRV